MHSRVRIIHHVTRMRYTDVYTCVGGSEGLGAGGVLAVYGVGLGGAGIPSISESHLYNR